jgi:hypothetical protein
VSNKDSKIVDHVIGIIPKEFFRKFLPEKPVIVEAGAHVGSDTIQMGSLRPKGNICAFEPVPELVHTLKKTLRAAERNLLSSGIKRQNWHG